MRLNGWATIKWSFLLIMIVLLDFPFFIMLITSLKTKAEVFNTSIFLPKHWEFANYIKLWKSTGLGNYFLNSIKISLGSTILVLLFSIPTAYALSRLQFIGKNIILSLLLVIQMFSPIVILVPLYKMFAMNHLLDNIWSLILINTTFSISFAVWFMYTFFNHIPTEIDEAAQIDGCNEMTTLFKILAPLAVPSIVTVAIFSFINAWNEFLFALTFIQSDNKMPITIGLYSFVGRYDVQWNYMMGASLLSTIPVLILFILIHKHLVKGLAAGAIK
ncbi:carbohydrate ABC transporter permease [Bacillaceae bacterium C204]|uniref:carbohydrate ABC transporter permease n=1 Tax=Neobacillus sp. 204 TaxID=3383351 RepID=UPI0039784892